MSEIIEYIEINSAVMMGKPVIKGTRITVEMIVDELAAGYSFEDILKAHPHLTNEAVLAALQYAAAVLRNERIYLAAS
jgi:uncharacterized protein (DUF433 family)